MGFQQVLPRTRLSSNEPKATVSKRGHLTINRALMREWGDVKEVKLFFDDDAAKVMLVPSESAEDTYSLTIQKSGSGMVMLRQVMTHMRAARGLGSVYATAQVPHSITEDGALVLDVAKVVNAK